MIALATYDRVKETLIKRPATVIKNVKNASGEDAKGALS
jgi:hypothetical protein